MNEANTANIAVATPAASGRSYLYAYLFDHSLFTLLILQYIVSNNLIMTVTTRLAICSPLCDLRRQNI